MVMFGKNKIALDVAVIGEQVVVVAIISDQKTIPTSFDVQEGPQ